MTKEKTKIGYDFIIFQFTKANAPEALCFVRTSEDYITAFRYTDIREEYSSDLINTINSIKESN